MKAGNDRSQHEVGGRRRLRQAQRAGGRGHSGRLRVLLCERYPGWGFDPKRLAEINEQFATEFIGSSAG
jgi:hypothetical protein